MFLLQAAVDTLTANSWLCDDVIASSGFQPHSSGVWKGMVATGEHWTGSPNKSVDQIGKRCQENVQENVFSAPPDNFWTFLGFFSTFFGHFIDIPFFCQTGLSNDLPVTKAWGSKMASSGGIFYSPMASC